MKKCHRNTVEDKYLHVNNFPLKPKLTHNKVIIFMLLFFILNIEQPVMSVTAGTDMTVFNLNQYN